MGVDACLMSHLSLIRSPRWLVTEVHLCLCELFFVFLAKNLHPMIVHMFHRQIDFKKDI
jgi:hypothetical protein